MKNQRPMVAIYGGSNFQPNSKPFKDASTFARLIAEYVHIFHGGISMDGDSGLMLAVTQGAQKRGNCMMTGVVHEAIEHWTIKLLPKNQVKKVANFDIRNGILTDPDKIRVVCKGDAGTQLECFTAVRKNEIARKMKVDAGIEPIIALYEKKDEWETIAKCFKALGMSSEVVDNIKVFTSPVDAAYWVVEKHLKLMLI